jgi:hypothetical protein
VELTAGFVGTVRVNLVSSTVELVDVLLTMKPRPAAAVHPGGDGTPAPQAPPTPYPEEDDQAPIASGVKLVAGALESWLQQIKVVATDVVVRLEVPNAALQLVVNASSLAISGTGVESNPREMAGMTSFQLAKKLEFGGVVVQMVALDAGDEPLSGCTVPLLTGNRGGSAGCSGKIDLLLSWGLGNLPSLHVGAACEAVAVQLQLGLSDIESLMEVIMELQKCRPSTPDPLHAEENPPSADPWGSESFMTGLMLPDCKSIVTETFYDVDAQEDADAFHDAASFLLTTSSMEQSRAHHLAASVRHVSQLSWCANLLHQLLV